MKRFFIASGLFLILFFFRSLSAKDITALFLTEVEPSVKLYSLGNIFTSVTPSDAFYNPWALGWTVNSGFTFSRWPGTLEDSQFNFLGIIFPWIKNRGKFNFNYLTYSAGEDTIEELDGTIRKIKLEEDRIISLGYGLRLGQKVFVGSNIKYLSSILADEYKDTTFLFDFGMLFHTLNERHNLGFSIRNYGGRLKYGSVEEYVSTELKFGYSYKFKLIPNHKLLLGTSLSKVVDDNIQIFSFGFEYSPGLPFILLYGGFTKRENSTNFTTGIGVNYNTFELNFGYSQPLKNSFAKDNVSFRFSLNWLFGPRNPFSIAEAYLKQGMKEKALALWKDILPGERYYVKAQQSIRKYMYSPELVVSVFLEDDSGDEVLAGGENGYLILKIANKGKGEAERLRILINKKEPNIVLGTYSSTIQKISAGEEKLIKIPISAKKEILKAQIPIEISVLESRGFNSPLYTYQLKTKPFSPPVLILAKYTFREDNTGHSIGNGDGMIEKGEQIEITGYVINVGESPGENVMMEIISDDSKIKVLPEFKEIKLGDIKPNQWKKVIFVFNVAQDYKKRGRLPITVKLKEKREKYTRIQNLESSINRFYQDPIEPIFSDVEISKVRQLLPPLAGPIPGRKVEEIIKASPGEPPILEYEVKLLPDKNGNNIYEPGEKLSLQIGIRNIGKGYARDIELILSGDKTITTLLGERKIIGDIEPGKYKPVLLEREIPKSIPRKEAVFKLKLKEARGFAPRKVKEMRVALMPKEIEIVRELPKLVPWPDTYRNKRANAGAVVVGISDYKNVDKLKYGSKDAELVSRYLNGVFGVPEKNIKKFFDDKATKSVIETAVKDWLAKKNFDFVVFYFAGHGVPDPENPRTGEPYIIPSDGDLDLGKGTLISLNELVSSLENSSAKDIFIIFDACFSGAGGRTPEKFVKAQRGVAIVPEFKQKRAIILSSSKETQPSLEFDEVGHGYFTYYFLLGLKGKADENKDGWISLSELYNFVKTNLEKELGDKQTPTCRNLKDLKLGKYR